MNIITLNFNGFKLDVELRTALEKIDGCMNCTSIGERWADDSPFFFSTSTLVLHEHLPVYRVKMLTAGPTIWN